MKDVERKLAAARTRLILEKPFLGALVLRLPLVEAHGSWCTTSATDARSIYYSAEYIEPLSLSQVQFVLAHEALHCGLSHFARREHRDLNRWNIACDHAVNPLLIEDGLELPPDALYNSDYTGLSAEEIYPLIKSDTKEETQDQHLYDNTDGQDGNQQHTDDPPPPDDGNRDGRPDPESQRQGQQPQPKPEPSEPRQPKQPQTEQPQTEQQQSAAKNNELTGESNQNNGSDSSSAAQDSTDLKDSRNQGTGSQPPGSTPPAPLSAQEKAQLNTQWQQRLVSAAQQASLAGKMNGSVARIIERLLRSTVPWRTLLARFMSGSSRVDYNMMRPSQRRSGDAILPSLHTRQTNVVIALDTSGSIEQHELALFVAEVNAIKSLVNARITLLACDSQLDEGGPWEYESWDQLVLPKTFQGGGGTDFTPVFNWLQTMPGHADLLIYFTDAQGRFPTTPPVIETLWLVKGSASVPWGQRIQLN